MDARKVGSLAIWGICVAAVGIGCSPKAFAQEVHAQTAVSSSGRMVVPERGAVSPTTQAVVTAMVRLAAIEDAMEKEERLLAIVWPPRRFGFERLRRILPYGVNHDPVTRYLTDDQLQGPEDY